MLKFMTDIQTERQTNSFWVGVFFFLTQFATSLHDLLMNHPARVKTKTNKTNAIVMIQL